MAYMGSYMGYQGHDLSVTTLEPGNDGIVSRLYWVAVKEFNFSYHKMGIVRLIFNNRTSLL